MPPAMDQSKNNRLTELALVFLKLGTVAFGGPAAHVAMMDEQIVRQRGWLTNQEFLDYLSATNFIPGPNSTEMAIHIGHRRAGWLGLIVAGTCFILPAAMIVTAIGSLAFIAMLVLGAYAPDLRSGHNGGSHALSNAGVDRSESPASR